MADINLNIGGNTTQLMRDIEKTVNRVYSINLKTKGEQPLGRITGKVNEFNKSLDASNARVIAFGASAGLIFGVQKAFSELARSTIEVQKSLQDINVILNVSTSQLQKFGGELFNIAKNTGQSFDAVAAAATEFSRQGLGVAETLKRTNEALILARLSGLDTVKSVEALTAAVNSFASQAVTATEVVNKFATVDAAFAVSSADLAEAIARVGSSAAQSGVSLNELIAIVTAAQQTTARGGAVIGNSFKTIFTRLQRTKVVSLLESLGVETVGAGGELKSTIDLLQDLGRVYDTLGTQQQAYVAEQVGGVFQINILKAALADLGKEYSIYNSALEISSTATDQAIKRNEELNKTYAAQLNALKENARQAGATIGGRVLGPAFDRVVGNANELLGGINESDGEGVGAVLGRGILDGLGQVLAGPGLVLIGGVLFKLFKDLAGFATQSFQQLLGLNTASTQQRDLQQSINQILQKNPQLLELALKGEQGLANAANILLQNLRAQTVELQKQSAISAQLAKTFYGAGVRVSGGVPVAPSPRTGRAAGYIPNFAADDFAREELLAQTLGAKNPKAQMSKGTIDGKKFIKNNREIEITGFGRNGDSAVIPTYGKGFIPNFAKKNINEKEYGYLVPSITPGGAIGTDGVVPPGLYRGFTFSGTSAKAPSRRRIQTVSDPIEESVKKSVVEAAARYSQQLQPLGRSVGATEIEQGFQTIAGAKGALQSAVGSAFEVAIVKSLDYQSAQREAGGNFDVRGGAGIAKIIKLFNIPGIRLADFKVSTSPDNIASFRDKIIKEKGVGAFEGKEISVNARKDALNELRNDPKWASAFRKDGQLRTGFNLPEGFNQELEKRTRQIINRDYNPRVLTRRGRALGYIPNFAAIEDAINRERDAGIPKNQIYLAQEKALTSANPMGLGVFNKLDEPTKSSRKDAMRKKGFAKGYIPNFADPAAPTEDVAGALALQLGSILPLVALSAQRGDEYAKSLQTITEENKKAGRVTNKLAKAQQDAVNKIYGPLTKEQSKIQASNAPFAPTTRQKLGARFGGGGGAAFAVAAIAPIIAETIKQGIDQGTKEGRVKGAVTSGLGQTAAFAATGAAVGGPIGAVVGAVAGAGLTLKGILDEVNTDLPELSAAAQKASESLTRFNDQSQRILTGFEQVKELREAGQATRAGELEAQLLKDISVDFAGDEDLAFKASTAVLNKDFEALQKALAENTIALTERTQEAQRQESITKAVETLRDEGTDSRLGKQAVESLGLELFKNIDVTQGPVNTQSLDDLIKSFQEAEKTNASLAPNAYTATPAGPVRTALADEMLGREDFIKIVEASDLEDASKDVVIELLEKGATIKKATAVLESYKKNVENSNDVQKRIAVETNKNNKVIKLIGTALSNVASNFNKLSSLSSEALAIQSVFNQARQAAISDIQVADLTGRAEIAETFGGQEQARRLGIRAERTQISGDFDKEVGTALANVTDLIGQSLNAGISQGFKNIGSFGEGSEEDQAKQQLAEAQRLAEAQLPDNIAQQISGIVDSEAFTKGTGLLDPNAIAEALQQSLDFAKLSPEDQTKALEDIRKEVSKSNQVLQKSVVEQEKQTYLLANRELNKIIKELVTSAVNAFGGLDKFGGGKALDDTIADDINKNLAERAGFLKTEGVPSRETQTEVGRRAVRLLDLGTEILGGRTGVFTPDLKLVQEEIQGQANNIEKIFNQIRDAATGPDADEGAREYLETIQKSLIQQSGVQGEELARAQAGDMRPVFEALATIQSLERRRTAPEAREGIRQNALEILRGTDENLADAIEKGFKPEEFNLANTIATQQLDQLKQIRQILEKTESEVPRAELEQRASELQTLEDAIVAPAAQAGIQLPGTEGITDAIYNNIPMLSDFNNPFAFGPTDFTSSTDPNASSQALDGGPGVPSWVEAAQGNLTDQNYYGPLYDAGRRVDLDENMAFLNKPSLNYDPFQSPSEIMLPRSPDSNNFPIGDPNSFIGYKDTPAIYGTEDIESRLNLDNLPQYNVTPGLGVGINPTNETFEETSQLRDSIQEEVSAVNNLTTSITTLSEQLGRGNVEAGSNQNLTGGTFGDITVTPAAISVTVEGSLAQDKIAEIEKVLREQSDQNVTQVIAELNQKVARLEELGNNITAQNPGVRPPPRGAGGAR